LLELQRGVGEGSAQTGGQARSQVEPRRLYRRVECALTAFPSPSPALELEPGLKRALSLLQHLGEGQTVNA